MKQINAFEAEAHFSALLREVERGETIVVTRNGKPVARMIPAAQAHEKPSNEKLIERIRARAARIAMKPSDIRELIDEGRRS